MVFRLGTMLVGWSAPALYMQRIDGWPLFAVGMVLVMVGHQRAVAA